MSTIDLIVLFGTLFTIVAYGTWKTRKNKSLDSYLKGDNQLKWATIGLSIMATQASAITFLSTTGKAYETGMEFVQFYFGLPIAMVVLSTFILPIYYKLKVYTAYEYLEKRFDLNTRLFTALLFLVQRGLAAGLTIYAPAIILSTILGWDLRLTNLLVGSLVIIYTVSGGSKAVSLTQKWQMAIIMGGMFIAFYMIISYLPDNVSFTRAVDLAGNLDKMNVVDFNLDVNSRYNIWAGIFGGFFLFMSYFGTDQSQVQRYLGGKSLSESRMGLMFNGLLKIPMQFFILFVGIMLFVFYQFTEPPIYFKEHLKDDINKSEYVQDFERIENEFSENWKLKKEAQVNYADALNSQDVEQIGVQSEKAKDLANKEFKLREEYKSLLVKAEITKETKDYDYIFISWILKYLPKGLIGLLLAVIFSAAMSSTAGELNALASTTTIDFYKTIVAKNASEKHYLNASKLITIGWGVLAICFALLANMAENLIEAVNILGSIFYGTILGIFVVAFFIKFVKAKAVLFAGIIAEATVIVLYFTEDIGFLWFNFIGCALVVLMAILFQILFSRNDDTSLLGDNNESSKSENGDVDTLDNL